jgi:hypothetical protein
MIEKISQNSSQQLALFSVKNKEVSLSFTGQRISSDGGLLLLRELDNKLGLIKSISSCIKDPRDQRYIDHEMQELIAQRVYQIAAGYEDCNDSNVLREDQIVKMCAGRLPQTGDDLASQPTMSRLENQASRTDLFRMGIKLLDNFIDSYSREPKVIILDCDDTNTNTHGQQELSLFNHYYDEYCYMPLHIYEGLSGKLITTILKPGRRSKQAETGNLLIKLIKYIRKRWANTTIIVRGDSHFTSSDLMDWCHDKDKVNFITGLTGNAKLKEKAHVTIKSAEREFEQYGKPVKRYHCFIYKAGSWKYSQRVIVKIEISHMGSNIRYIVTDVTGFRTRDLYEKGYCARGAMELRIKDHKLYLKSDRASCNKFSANQFRLFLHSMAYVLIHTFQSEMLQGTEYATATFKTIREKILKTAAVIKELKTRIKIEMPSSCITKELQTGCYDYFALGFT